MSNFATLQFATNNVGDYYQTVEKSGQLARDRADLILLTGNPLNGLENVASRAGVIVRGRWISKAEFQARLAQILAAAK